MRQEVLLLMFCMFTTSCCGVFYTSSKANDYPRIGRRSFFTSSKENTYPRMGRSGDDGKVTIDMLKRRFTAGDSASYPRLGRAGYFTKGAASYPRLGRSSNSLDVEDIQDLMPDSDEELPQRNIAHLGLQAPLAFLLWDKNGDGHLSKSEFLTGLSKTRHRPSHKK
ncbi:hypothetical protein LOTGIDRAFT_173607 [Lottia gigantea]|uniref:EF-hand domain-containing protein n=1 Tax=Lottia gigantea TaxID=225164 RepID=V4AX83_LOTGI|nr:hypothetical protein LOTGIDRAFT_173607 [Lottia gigantea]ESO99665.1 hypothetical protein LOTGIDRAFT_173607 [Lottia gigantea]